MIKVGAALIALLLIPVVIAVAAFIAFCIGVLVYIPFTVLFS